MTIHNPINASNGWNTQPGYTLYGVAGKEGIVTWGKSDE